MFFEKCTAGKSGKNITRYEQCLLKEKTYYNNILDVPFSNRWVASYLYNKLPKDCVVHLGIVSSFLAWNQFKLDNSIRINCNQGGFGIDGNISSLLGASLINPKKIYYCFIGDLAFFYDMNALGNRHIGNNIRILLVNNGKGVLFRKPWNLGSIFGDEADLYISAGAHFGNQNPELVKNFAINLGFDYITASTKKAFIQEYEKFVDPEIHDKPMLFEIFVSTEDEIEGDKNIRPTEGIKGKLFSLLGEDVYDYCKNMLKPTVKGKMHIDIHRK